MAREQFLVKGHTLEAEGLCMFNSSGNIRGIYDSDSAHAKCSCGVLSWPSVSRSQARTWHREHKQVIADEIEKAKDRHPSHLGQES